MSESFWTPDRIERCKSLWSIGWSASQIAHALGCSRNAVLSKLHRSKANAREPKLAPATVTVPVTLDSDEAAALDHMMAEGGFASRAELVRSLVSAIIEDDAKAHGVAKEAPVG